MASSRTAFGRTVARARSTVDLARDQFSGFERLYRRFGPVSRLYNYTYLLGSAANQFIFAHSDLFSWREAFDLLVPVDGETAMIVSDGDDHRRRRRLVQPAFSRGRIDGYVSVMAANADALVESWRPGREVDLYQEFRTAIRRGTIRALFGERLAADEPYFGRQLQVALDLLELNPALLPVRKYLPAYRRALAARERVRVLVQQEIDLRRTTDEDAPDVLTALVRGRDDDGNQLTDTEICDQVISLIVAGYETTSAAMGWAIRAMLLNPERWKRVQTEACEVIGPDRPVAAADLPRLSYLDGLVNETLRLHPPAAISLRKSVRAFEFDGVRVPAGRSIIYSPYVTHRMPEVWPDPLRFDPARWDPDSPDHRKPGPHEFLPFGGGPHRCIGAHFATTELKTLLAQVVRKTRLELLSTDSAAVGLAAMRPKNGVPARVLSL